MLWLVSLAKVVRHEGNRRALKQFGEFIIFYLFRPFRKKKKVSDYKLLPRVMEVEGTSVYHGT